MTRHLSFLALWVGGSVFLAIMSGQAEASQLSHERLAFFDERGYFTPAFKAAIHELVETRQAIAQASEEEKKLKNELPGLQKQSGEDEAKVAGLQQELAQYDHPEERDFAMLQARMNDAAAKPEEQIMLAQAYVWAYPADPHQAAAQQYLQQVQKKLADQQQAEKEAEAARAAAHAKLVQRAQAKDLSLAEWKDFLRDMSQEDLLKCLGPPSFHGNGYWTYTGAWTTDPTTGQKVGLRIDFNGSRVISVVQGPQ
jgi:chromosome segregation ATPase